MTSSHAPAATLSGTFSKMCSLCSTATAVSRPVTAPHIMCWGGGTCSLLSRRGKPHSFENRGATALHPSNTAVAVWAPVHKADMPVAQRAAPAGPHRNHHGGCHPMGKWRMQRRTWELPALSRPQRTGPHQQGKNFPRHSCRNGRTMGRARDYLIISPPLFAEAGRGRHT